MMVNQTVKNTEEAIREELKEEVESLKAVGTKHTQRIDDLERRKIEFCLATGA